MNEPEPLVTFEVTRQNDSFVNLQDVPEDSSPRETTERRRVVNHMQAFFQTHLEVSKELQELQQTKFGALLDHDQLEHIFETELLSIMQRMSAPPTSRMVHFNENFTIEKEFSDTSSPQYINTTQKQSTRLASITASNQVQTENLADALQQFLVNTQEPDTELNETLSLIAIRLMIDNYKTRRKVSQPDNTPDQMNFDYFEFLHMLRLDELMVGRTVPCTPNLTAMLVIKKQQKADEDEFRALLRDYILALLGFETRLEKCKQQLLRQLFSANWRLSDLVDCLSGKPTICKFDL